MCFASTSHNHDMKRPRDLERLSLLDAETGLSLGPYPPASFWGLYDAEFGNGDCYGFYWPLGREKEEPVVCEMMHDSWTMAVCVSSATLFADWLGNDRERGDELEEPGFAPALFTRAKTMIAQGSFTEAIPLLERICSIFPENCEYWFALAGQLRRNGKTEEAVTAAIEAYTSTWSFGYPPEGLLRMIQAGRNFTSLADDPLVRRSAALTNKFGGDKENTNYPLLLECVREYFEIGKPLTALKLLQNHALMMSGETVSFCERYGFSTETWRREFSDLCEKHLGDRRCTFDP